MKEITRIHLAKVAYDIELDAKHDLEKYIDALGKHTDSDVMIDIESRMVELLAERLAAGLRPKLVYVVPNFHNPSGATMSLDRRRQLAALADQYELLIVEDDPYGAIRFAGEPLPPVASFTERVVHLSTFSKIVAPGFRVGWMIGPPEVMSWVARAKQAADLHTSTFAQQLLANVVSQPGWLDAQKERIVPMLSLIHI